MTDAVTLAIRRARRGLNRRYLLQATLLGAAIGSAAGLIPCLVAEGFGLSALGHLLWAGAIAVGALAALALAFPRRIDEDEAASWLDRSMGTRSLVCAAAFCLGRGLSGPNDEAILRAADAAIKEGASAAKPKWEPYRLRLLASIGSLAFCALLAWTATAVFEAVTEGHAPVSSALGTAPEESPGPSPSASPTNEEKELAQSLFPEDKRLSALAEKALAQGRQRDLEELIKRADAKLADQEDKASSPLEKADIAERRADLAQAATAARSALAGAQPSPGPLSSADPDGRGEGKKPAVVKKAIGQEDGSAVTDRDAGGLAAGKGGGRKKERGAIEAGAAGEKVDLGSYSSPGPEQRKLLEPSPRPRAASLGAAAAAYAARAEEAASGRSSVPVDYQTDIQSYFLELSRTAQGEGSAAPAAEGAKE